MNFHLTLGRILLPGIVIGTVLAANAIEEEGLLNSRIRRRVVKEFDFDERPFGNYDSVPKNWNPIHEPGFPRYQEPEFDNATGHEAPPSFELSAAVGSMGATYAAGDIPVDTTSDYRVTGWVRTRGLQHARAFLVAYYLDAALRKIPRSEHRSVPIGGCGGVTDWQEVRINLPGGCSEARWIGLTCLLEQPGREELNSQTRSQTGTHGQRDRTVTDADDEGSVSAIRHNDVAAAAWFDDIRVLRLPQIELTLTTPGVRDSGQVFAQGERIDCSVRVSDADGSDLASRLAIHDLDGKLILSRAVNSTAKTTEAFDLSVKASSAGIYRAGLEVEAAGQVLLSTQSTFVRLGPDGPFARNHGAGFGVLLDSRSLASPASPERLLKFLSVDIANVTLWSEDTSDEAVVFGDPTVANLLSVAAKQHLTLAATLQSVPEALERHAKVNVSRQQNDGPNGSMPADYQPRGKRSVIDVLALEPDLWRPYLGLLAARYGTAVKHWQIGTSEAVAQSRRNDNGTRPRTPPRLSEQSEPLGDDLTAALHNARSELAQLVDSPQLVVPWPAELEMSGADLAADCLAMTVPRHVPASRLADQLTGFLGTRIRQKWLMLERPAPATYSRLTSLTDFARQLIAARSTGVDCVFVPQPWERVSDSASETASHPHKEGASRAPLIAGASAPQISEEFLFTRTLAQTLGGLGKGTPVWFDRGVEARLFTDQAHRQGALVVWTEGDEGKPRRLTAPLLQRTQRFDMWGNVQALTASEQGWEFDAGPMPVVLAPVDPEWVEFQANFGMEGEPLQVGLIRQKRMLRLVNAGRSQLRGTLRLQARGLGHVEPRRLALNIAPGKTLRTELSFDLPSNQANGEYLLEGQLQTEDEQPLRCTLRAPLSVATPGLDVNVLSTNDGNELRIVQRVTNHTDRPLELRSVLVVPEQLPQVKRIPHLGIGQSAVREYQVLRPAVPSPRPIRVSVEEIDGHLAHHRIIAME